MDHSLKLYWELYARNVSNNQILRQIENPIRGYEEELIEGSIIDIGCGQSSFLLDYAFSNRSLVALDNEKFQLDFLKKRLCAVNPESEQNCTFLNQSFPKDGLPRQKYALIILSNILHFYNIREGVEIATIISSSSVTGTLIYVCVHSEKHPDNNPENPHNNNYFKHYFTVEDVRAVFQSYEFEELYIATIKRLYSSFERKLMTDWANEMIKVNRIRDLNQIAEIMTAAASNISQADIVAIFRKK